MAAFWNDGEETRHDCVERWWRSGWRCLTSPDFERWTLASFVEMIQKVPTTCRKFKIGQIILEDAKLQQTRGQHGTCTNHSEQSSGCGVKKNALDSSSTKQLYTMTKHAITTTDIVQEKQNTKKGESGATLTLWCGDLMSPRTPELERFVVATFGVLEEDMCLALLVKRCMSNGFFMNRKADH